MAGLSPRLLALAPVLGPMALLGGALVAQYGFLLLPCEMCIWQRWPHGIALALGLLALVARGRLRALLLALAALVLLIGAGIGAFHAGVEQHWWEGPTACTGAPPTGLSGAAFLETLKGRPLIRCDEIAWSFLGLSMAAWNALISTGLAAATALAARAYASSSASQ